MRLTYWYRNWWGLPRECQWWCSVERECLNLHVSLWAQSPKGTVAPPVVICTLIFLIKNNNKKCTPHKQKTRKSKEKRGPRLHVISHRIWFLHYTITMCEIYPHIYEELLCNYYIGVINLIFFIPRMHKK